MTRSDASALELSVVGRSRAGSDIAVQVVARIVNLALGVVATVVLIRALGDSRFGQWATVFAVVEVVGYLSELGLEQVAVRRAAADPRREADWVGALIALRLALALPVILACLAILLPISSTDEMRATSLVICGTMFTGAIGAARSVFQLRVRNHVTVGILTLNSVLWTVAVVLIAAGGDSMVAFAGAFLGAAVVTNGLQLLLALRTATIDLRAPLASWRALAHAGIPLGVAVLLTIAYVRIDGVIVFGLAGAREAGLYSAIYRVLDRAQFLPLAVMTTLLPILAAAGTARIRRLVQVAADYLVAATLPALGFSIVAAAPVVELLFGAEFSDAAPALPILMGTFVALSLNQLAVGVIVVLERQRRLALYALAGLAVNVALNLALVPAYGFLAAAWVTALTQVLVLILSMRLVLQSIDLVPSFARMARAVLAAAGMTLAVLALREAGAPLGMLALVAVTTYVAALAALRGLDVRRDLATLFQGTRQ